MPCIEEDGLEADDIIACYSMAALDSGWKVTIVSSDKDLMQLVEDGRLDLYDTMNERRIGRDYVIEKFGVPPEQLGEVLALMGDSVDNVPGVPGVGPKTAAQLIQQYGDVEDVLAACRRHRQAQAAPESDRACRQCRACRASWCGWSAICRCRSRSTRLEMKGIPPDPLREFLEEQGFKSLLSRLAGQSQVHAPSAAPQVRQRDVRPEPKIDRSSYETVTSLDALDRWIAKAKRNGFVALDTETDGFDCVTAKLVGISLATECGKACYIPLEHGGHDLLSERPTQISADDALGAAEAVAGGSGGPQDRPQFQVRLDRLRPSRDLRRTGRRQPRDELQPRRRRAEQPRAWTISPGSISTMIA